jgi:hypothetical protein
LRPSTLPLEAPGPSLVLRQYPYHLSSFRRRGKIRVKTMPFKYYRFRGLRYRLPPLGRYPNEVEGPGLFPTGPGNLHVVNQRVAPTREPGMVPLLVIATAIRFTIMVKPLTTYYSDILEAT